MLINGVSIQEKVWTGQRVLLLSDIGKVHGVSVSIVRGLILKYIRKTHHGLIENIDVFRVSLSICRDNWGICCGAKELCFITESGYRKMLSVMKEDNKAESKYILEYYQGVSNRDGTLSLARDMI